MAFLVSGCLAVFFLILPVHAGELDRVVVLSLNNTVHACSPVRHSGWPSLTLFPPTRLSTPSPARIRISKSSHTPYSQIVPALPKKRGPTAERAGGVESGGRALPYMWAIPALSMTTLHVLFSGGRGVFAFQDGDTALMGMRCSSPLGCTAICHGHAGGIWYGVVLEMWVWRRSDDDGIARRFVTGMEPEWR
ncbi:hypothetical protein BS50DRAFT_387521 [Corynespora cassiicola Philippines]|uniref:Uncharacterized protein n=1 Tax=Corynespora cassiicola Philippines TaxID=1448308 RepID=A0A2T2NPC9_CORCC|nr:hypothetical protein BS50DRAFT_387521 [Corynespora cassiicola Philippines]